MTKIPFPTWYAKRKRGKPRRGKTPANVRTVRIDQEAETTLIDHFGTLGNALYHIFRGIVIYRNRLEADAIDLARRAKYMPAAYMDTDYKRPSYVNAPPPAVPINTQAPKPVPLDPDPIKALPIPSLPEADWSLIANTLQAAADTLAKAEPPYDPTSPRATPPLSKADRLESALRRLEFVLGRTKPRGVPY